MGPRYLKQREERRRRKSADTGKKMPNNDELEVLLTVSEVSTDGGEDQLREWEEEEEA